MKKQTNGKKADKGGVKTKNLTLTPMSDEALAQLRDAETDGHMKKAYGEMLEGCLAHPAQRLFYTDWQIALRADGTPVGGVGFRGPAVNGEVEIGYEIEAPYRRKGYGEEAVKALTDWAFEQEDAYLISAETEPGNEASRALLHKLGFKASGVGREGPRYELERPASSWLTFGMCIGMCFGVSIGSAMKNTALGIPIGMCIGMAIGASLDAADKKKREAFSEARRQAKAAADGGEQPAEQKEEEQNDETQK